MMQKASAERQRVEFQTELLHHCNSCVRDCEPFGQTHLSQKAPKKEKRAAMSLCC